MNLQFILAFFLVWNSLWVLFYMWKSYRLEKHNKMLQGKIDAAKKYIENTLKEYEDEGTV